MSAIVQGYQLTALNLGTRLKGQTADITTNGPKTYSLFAVAGGEVLITALWGKVTTAISTASESLNLQMHPTTGDLTVIVSATNLGSSATAAGDVLGVTAGTLVPATGYKAFGTPMQFVASTGQIESAVVTASSNGVVDWYCTWLPLTPGATVAASTVAPA